MSRQWKPVKDLRFEEAKSWTELRLQASPDTRRALETLEDLFLEKSNFALIPTNVITREEYQRRFREYVQTTIGLDTIRTLAKTQKINPLSEIVARFESTLPDDFEVAKVGRPPGYLPIETRRKIVRGEILGLLLNIGYHTLMRDVGEKGAA